MINLSIAISLHRKLPNNLAFKDISFNLGTFPYVTLSNSILRMDILRYIPGANMTQIQDSFFMLLTPDNSIIGCFQIQRNEAKAYFLDHNVVLQSFFWGKTGLDMIKKYQTRCVNSNIKRGRFVGYIRSVSNV